MDFCYCLNSKPNAMKYLCTDCNLVLRASEWCNIGCLTYFECTHKCHVCKQDLDVNKCNKHTNASYKTVINCIECTLLRRKHIICEKHQNKLIPVEDCEACDDKYTTIDCEETELKLAILNLQYVHLI